MFHFFGYRMCKFCKPSILNICYEMLLKPNASNVVYSLKMQKNKLTHHEVTLSRKLLNELHCKILKNKNLVVDGYDRREEGVIEQRKGETIRAKRHRANSMRHIKLTFAIL